MIFFSKSSPCYKKWLGMSVGEDRRTCFDVVGVHQLNFPSKDAETKKFSWIWNITFFLVRKTIWDSGNSPREPVMRISEISRPKSSRKSCRTPPLAATLIAKVFPTNLLPKHNFLPHFHQRIYFRGNAPPQKVHPSFLDLIRSLWRFTALYRSLREVCQSLTEEMKIAKVGFQVILENSY